MELLSLSNIIILCSVNWLTNRTEYKEWHPVGHYVTYISVAVILITFMCATLYQLRLKVCSKALKSMKGNESADESLVESYHFNGIPLQISSVVAAPKCAKWRELLLDSKWPPTSTNSTEVVTVLTTWYMLSLYSVNHISNSNSYSKIIVECVFSTLTIHYLVLCWKPLWANLALYVSFLSLAGDTP